MVSPVGREIKRQCFPGDRFLALQPVLGHELCAEKLRQGLGFPREVFALGVPPNLFPSVRGDHATILVQYDEGRDAAHPEFLAQAGLLLSSLLFCWGEGEGR